VPLRALGGTALVTVVDWGAYEWASNTGHGTIGMIAGIVLVPAGVALAGLLGATLFALVRGAMRSAAARRQDRSDIARRGGPPATPQGDVGNIVTRRGRVAA